MSDILDNALVRKYFGIGKCLGTGNPPDGNCVHPNCMALRILRAMQEPIRKGDLVLERFPSNADNEWQLTRCSIAVTDMHAAFLRLPDVHQTKECEHYVTCEGCQSPIPVKPSPAPGQIRVNVYDREHKDSPAVSYDKPSDTVEARIKAIENEVPACDFRKHYAREWLSKQLRELVELCRREK